MRCMEIGAMLEPAFDISGRRIGAEAPPFVIAEAGSNFDQSLEKAMRLIDAAADAAADAVKFQLFRAEALYPAGSEMHGVFKALELKPDWLSRLTQRAKSRGLIFLASAFDAQSLETLERLNVPAHKVASSEATNPRILGAMARTGKPLIVSTGMCDGADIADAVQICLAAGNRRVALLQCCSVYPLPINDANLRVMDMLATHYGGAVGYSDHTLGNTAAIAAVARGACIIEKHFTLDRTSNGPDHFYALEPAELKRFVADLRDAHAALGSAFKGLLPDERKYGRREGLYAARDIATGQILEAADIAVRPPALGARARFAAAAVGARTRRRIAKDEPIALDDLDL